MADLESSGSSASSPEKPEIKTEAKPAAKKTAPAKKALPETKPFVDNGDGTITDPNTGLIWKKADAWLDTRKFYTWQAHREYVDKINKEKFAGHDNWRIPNKSEAVTLVDKTGTKQCEDKNGTMFPIDPIFDSGCVSNTWISECSDDQIIRFDLKIGIEMPYPGKDVWGSVRLVSKPGEESARVGKEPTAPKPSRDEEEKPADRDSKPEVASSSTASSKPKGSVPRPVSREVSEEQKAILKARAKAFAESKKKK